MVYLKINPHIASLLASCQAQLGCSSLCDKQLLSFKDLEILLNILNKDRDRPLQVRDIAGQTELVYIDTHECNTNLKDQNRTKSDVISQKKESYLDKEYPLTEEEKKKLVGTCETQDEEKRWYEKEKMKIEFRALHRMYNKQTKGFSQHQTEKVQMGKTVKQASQAMSFAMMLLSSFFLTFLAGYFVGSRYLGANQTISLIVSALMGIGLMFLETLMYMMKIQKTQQKIKQK